ncbi:hypothetical protein HYT58_00950 [Candidatus Woesearchaeota archaeon]|nr:hypothetical protein [Candidatus Woesearchaeota archaeon]
MVGPDEFVKNTKTPAPYKALLGTDNTAEIQNVWSWLTGVDPFLWRVNSRPQEEVETVAGFGASAGGAMLSCDWYPQDSDAAVAVRVARSPS